ncbi:hypothetical protein [Actinomadura flavalba]|uniref:hypothetical protein n=1 Tax=Actinomadura flavalba TaxID=1120938 RepID=UPI0003774A87|nr:hypothetical protein [Actinomadura flavalba]
MTVGPELFGFPPPVALPDLRWLGPDYVSVLVYDLTRGLLRQDPGTQVMGVRCEGDPDLRASVDSAGVIRSHDAAFPLQVFVQDGDGRPWRLRGRWTYSGRDLGTASASINHYWQMHTAEGV